MSRLQDLHRVSWAVNRYKILFSDTVLLISDLEISGQKCDPRVFFRSEEKRSLRLLFVHCEGEPDRPTDAILS
jgi:hypothetical protein